MQDLCVSYRCRLYVTIDEGSLGLPSKFLSKNTGNEIYLAIMHNEEMKR